MYRGNGEYNRSSYRDFGFMYFINQSMNESVNQTKQNLLTYNKSEKARWRGGKASDSRADGRVRSSLSGPRCVLEQDKFTSQKYW